MRFTTVFTEPREIKQRLFIVIAGDRGLAGGYNSNIFKLTRALAGEGDALYIPIGKKALEHFRLRGAEIYSDLSAVAADVGVGMSMELGDILVEGKVDCPDRVIRRGR